MKSFKTVSIVEDTHGPRVVVDGQLVFESLGLGKLKIGTGLIDGKPIDVKEVKVQTKMGEGISYTYNYSYGYKNEPQFFLPDAFDKVKSILESHKGPWELSAQSDNIILVWKGITSVDEYIRKKDKELWFNKIKAQGCLLFPLIFIAIMLLLKFFKK
jgi:hypothetical protein